MRNLFLFFYRNNFVLLFLLLEVFCFYLMMKNNNYQNASFFNSTNQVTASIYESVGYVKDYIGLKTKSEILAAENARFRAMMPESVYDTSLARMQINDTVFNQQYTYILAKAINNSVTKRNNYLTINKGSLSGIKPEMGVIGSNGVVGIIKDVSTHYSTVISFLHSKSSVSARFKNNNYFGALAWTDDDNPTTGTLKEIPKHITFKAGDSIVTTSFSSVYPENIFLGTVKNFTVKPGDNFYTITISLAANFYSLTHVYVVDNLFKQEQHALEEKLKNDN